MAFRHSPAGAIMLVLMAFMTSGCMSWPYKSDAQKNVTLKAETRPSMSVKAHIYLVDSKCRAKYKGTQKLNNSDTAVGVSTNKQSYFVFVFKRYSLLDGNNTILQDLLFTPRDGYQYMVSASYIDTMYQASVKERDPRGRWRKIPYTSLDDCVSAG